MPPAAAGMMPGRGGGKGGVPPSYGNMLMQASNAQPAQQMPAQMPSQANDWMRNAAQQMAGQRAQMPSQQAPAPGMMPAAAQQQMAAMLGSAPAQPMAKPRAQGKPLRTKPY